MEEYHRLCCLRSQTPADLMRGEKRYDGTNVGSKPLPRYLSRKSMVKGFMSLEHLGVPTQIELLIQNTRVYGIILLKSCCFVHLLHTFLTKIFKIHQKHCYILLGFVILCMLRVSTPSAFHYWVSEASPTLGSSIEISRDIYIYVYIYVCRYVSYVKLTA